MQGLRLPNQPVPQNTEEPRQKAAAAAATLSCGTQQLQSQQCHLARKQFASMEVELHGVWTCPIRRSWDWSNLIGLLDCMLAMTLQLQEAGGLAVDINKLPELMGRCVDIVSRQKSGPM